MVFISAADKEAMNSVRQEGQTIEVARYRRIPHFMYFLAGWGYQGTGWFKLIGLAPRQQGMCIFAEL